MKQQKVPTPRESNYLGMRSKPTIFSDGTWLEPEEMTYPSGGFHRKAYAVVRRNPNNSVSLPYGEKRLVRASIPDTAFSISAKLKYKGKTLRGFLSMDNDSITFTPEAE